MAYVRITQKLIDQIRNGIDRMADSARAKLKEQESLSSEDCDTIMQSMLDYAWKDHQDIRNKVPETWLDSSDSRAYLKVRDEEADSAIQLYIDVSRESPFRNKRQWPPRTSNYGSVRMHMDMAYINAMPDCLLKRHVTTAMTNQVKTKKINDQYHEIKTQVLTFFRSHTSVNAAVKEVEEMRMYLPAETLRKLDEKVERRAAKPKQTTHQADDDNAPTLDIKKIRAAAIAHRLS